MVLFYLMLFLILLISIKTPCYYDEGWAATNASRIASGEVPYRDFWLIYPPAYYYLLSHVFIIFDNSLLCGRLLDLLIRLSILLLLNRILASHSSKTIGAALTVAAALILSSVCSFLYAVFPALLLALSAIFSLTLTTNGFTNRQIYLSGFLTGLVSLFRIDFALYGFFTILVTSIINYELTNGSRANSYQSIILFAFSAISIPLSCFLYFSFQAGMKVFIDQILILPFFVLHK